MLILLWVQNEMSYDRLYKNADRLYQSWNRNRGNNGIECWNVTPKPLAPALKNDYPEIEKATRVDWDQTLLFSIGDKKINMKGNTVDPDFLTMFEFPFVKGNMNIALNNPTDIVITEKLSKACVLRILLNYMMQPLLDRESWSMPFTIASALLPRWIIFSSLSLKVDINCNVSF
jgi:hypothetical protein